MPTQKVDRKTVDRFYAYWTHINYVAVTTQNHILLNGIAELGKKKPNFKRYKYGEIYCALKTNNPDMNVSMLRARALLFCIVGDV